MQNTSARNNSIKMELSSPTYTSLKKDLFSSPIFYRRTFYLRGAVEVVLPFFHMKKSSAAFVCGLSSPVVG